MHLNTDPAAPAPRLRKPCLRDLATLLRDHLPPLLLKLVPMSELERRAQELRRTNPEFEEELPLVLSGEARRRAIAAGELAVSGRDVQFSKPASTASYA
jgi:hypothetical protein